MAKNVYNYFLVENLDNLLDVKEINSFYYYLLNY